MIDDLTAPDDDAPEHDRMNALADRLERDYAASLSDERAGDTVRVRFSVILAAGLLRGRFGCCHLLRTTAARRRDRSFPAGA